MRPRTRRTALGRRATQSRRRPRLRSGTSTGFLAEQRPHRMRAWDRSAHAVPDRRNAPEPLLVARERPRVRGRLLARLEDLAHVTRRLSVKLGPPERCGQPTHKVWRSSSRWMLRMPARRWSRNVTLHTPSTSPPCASVYPAAVERELVPLAFGADAGDDRLEILQARHRGDGHGQIPRPCPCATRAPVMRQNYGLTRTLTYWRSAPTRPGVRSRNPAWLPGCRMVERRGWDSNPRGASLRLAVFKTAPFNRSGTPPRPAIVAAR
jgi:hypothetical protein